MFQYKENHEPTHVQLTDDKVIYRKSPLTPKQKKARAKAKSGRQMRKKNR